MSAVEEYQQHGREAMFVGGACDLADAAIAELEAELQAIRTVLEVSDNTKTCSVLMLAENMDAALVEARAIAREHEANAKMYGAANGELKDLLAEAEAKLKAEGDDCKALCAHRDSLQAEVDRLKCWQRYAKEQMGGPALREVERRWAKRGEA